MKRQSHEDVEREILALDNLDTKALQQRWRELYKREPPPRIRAALLRRFIAYRLQVLAFGGLKPKTVKLLRKLADELRVSRIAMVEGRQVGSTPKLDQLRSATRLSPGTQLLREWNGSTETVEVSAEGYVWRDRTFGTLSAVATAITGTKWSGPRFFGLSQTKKTTGASEGAGR